MEAAECFQQGDENADIAHDLRVGVRSVQRWRKTWSHRRPRALASKGPVSLPLLSDELFAVLGGNCSRTRSRTAGGTRPGHCRGSRL
ncbi:hypothetical protein AB0P44_43295 [Streptomyces chartreusis]|uniref:hypothetical protein n=1 Tax=Streptomyces chartreusis TaxID=1969 RepID=UPI0034049A74